VGPFIGHISEFVVRVANNHMLTGISDRRDSHEALEYASLLRQLLPKESSAPRSLVFLIFRAVLKCLDRLQK